MNLIKGGKTDDSKLEGLERIVNRDPTASTYTLWQGTPVPIQERLTMARALWCVAKALGRPHLRVVEVAGGEQISNGGVR